jgi:hypothetical protein
MDDDVFPLEAADQRRTRQWQPGIERRSEPRLNRARFVQGFAQEVLGRANPQVGVISDLQRSLTSAFGQAAPRVRLDAPGDAAE